MEISPAGHPHRMNDNTTTTGTDPKHTDTATPPGPTDQGRTGGMATREVAPDVVKKHQEESGR